MSKHLEIPTTDGHLFVFNEKGAYVIDQSDPNKRLEFEYKHALGIRGLISDMIHAHVLHKRSMELLEQAEATINMHDIANKLLLQMVQRKNDEIAALLAKDKP